MKSKVTEKGRKAIGRQAVPAKAPFPETIIVTGTLGRIVYRLQAKFRSAKKAREYLSWYRNKHGSEVIKIKRGIWHLIYAW